MDGTGGINPSPSSGGSVSTANMDGTGRTNPGPSEVSASGFSLTMTGVVGNVI